MKYLLLLALVLGMASTAEAQCTGAGCSLGARRTVVRQRVAQTVHRVVAAPAKVVKKRTVTRRRRSGRGPIRRLLFGR